MNLEGHLTRLRALEPGDIDTMYAWENDTSVWAVSGTLSPFSRHTLERFIQEQQFDIFQTRQQRLIIETLEKGIPVGAFDLFELDPIHHRAGIGILVCDQNQRGKGYASDALATVCRYGREFLQLHQLWCNIGADNAASLRLFQNAGFIETGRKRDWLWTPAGYRDELLLQKML